MGYESCEIARYGFISPEFHYGVIWGMNAQYATREEAVSKAREMYDKKVKNNSSLVFPPFEECLRDAKPKAPHLNPNFGSVYLIMKPV